MIWRGESGHRRRRPSAPRRARRSAMRWPPCPMSSARPSSSSSPAGPATRSRLRWARPERPSTCSGCGRSPAWARRYAPPVGAVRTFSMPADKRGHDDPLERYWRAVADDADATPPAGLDPLAAETVRGLRSLRAPEPDPAFVARLGERLRRETTGRAPVAPAPTAAPVTSPPASRAPWPLPLAARRRWRPALAGLATAAVVVLAVIALQLWTTTESVSATAILHKAEATATGPARFRSFVITEVSEQYPAAVAGSDDIVTSESTRWYEAPGRWRREVTS